MADTQDQDQHEDPHQRPAAPAVDGVDDAGIRLRATDEVVVDVLFDGRRIWSFHALRDTQPSAGPAAGPAASPIAGAARSAPWPRRLQKYLHGTTRLTLRTHVAEEVLFDQEVTLGTGEGRIAVVNSAGQPLGMDKSGRLQLTFETRSAREVGPLLDAIEKVLQALREAGVEPFPAYGTLLGAVRDGRLIGHDSDADLAYVSRWPTPVDVIRESFRLQRRLARAGYQVRRYSGGGFAVTVEEADGSRRGLDVFTGFFTDDDHLVVMGEIRVPFRREWVHPLGTTTLEGRELPAPADTDRFLTATYGPSWRTPDPAFSFTTPPSTSRRLDDWFRGTVVNRGSWDGRYQSRLDRTVKPTPDKLARMVRRRERAAGLVVDLGCGHGHNAVWLAARGLPVEAFDFAPRGYRNLQARAERRGLPVSFAPMNLLEPRHVLAHGARLARRPGPHVLLARHILDALPPAGRGNLWRFASMLGRAGGRMYADFLTSAPTDDPWTRRNLLTPLDPDAVVAAAEAAGGRVLSLTEHDAGPPLDPPGGPRTAHQAAPRRKSRMVVEWHG